MACEKRSSCLLYTSPLAGQDGLSGGVKLERDHRKRCGNRAARGVDHDSRLAGPDARSWEEH